jgi:hypothetical protein
MKSPAILAIIGIIVLLSSPVFAKYSGGSGTPDDPWQISCPNDLLYLGAHPEYYDKHFLLVADINFAEYIFTTAVIAPDANNFNKSYLFDGTPFSGEFNGNGFIIRNLTIDATGTHNDYLGLFGRVEDGSRIYGLGIENLNIIGGDDSSQLGGLAAENYGAIISYCYVAGEVTGGKSSAAFGGLIGHNGYYLIDSYSVCTIKGGEGASAFGGLVGYNEQGRIEDCYALGKVIGNSNSSAIGGLIGSHSLGYVLNCYANNSVTVGSKSRYCGGLIGQHSYGSISNSYACGNVTAGNESSGIGGLVGKNGKAISNCYATGSVKGGNYSSQFGGLVGSNVHASIENCYSTGALIVGFSSNNAIGGFIGGNSSFSVIKRCLWDTQNSGTINGCGYNDNYSKADWLFGKTTIEMQTQSTFIGNGWDFVGETANGTVDIWIIREGKEYPKFLWQNNKPVADAGDDVNIIEIGTMVQLNGSASWDSDGDPISYKWSILEKPQGSFAELSDTNIVNPTFIADVRGRFMIQLIASDLWSSSEPNKVTISFENNKPVSDAGEDKIVRIGSVVGLDGSESYDSDGDVITYRWTFEAKPDESSAILSDANSADPNFIADSVGDFILSLVVNDGFEDSEPNEVKITVLSNQQFAINMLTQAVNIINQLSPENFSNKNLANPLVNKISAVLSDIEAGNYNGAINKLQNDILQKMDGCAANGQPDKNDWLITTDAQNQLYPLIANGILYLSEI